MSALGHKRTFAVQNVMSALPPKADINRGDRYVCFVADIGHSFDYLVGAGEQIVRNYKAERFGRL